MSSSLIFLLSQILVLHNNTQERKATLIVFRYWTYVISEQIEHWFMLFLKRFLKEEASELATTISSILYNPNDSSEK